MLSRFAIAAIVVGAVLAYGVVGKAAAPQPAAAPVLAASTAPEAVTFAALMAASAGEAKCSDFKMFAADEKDKCSATCKKGNTCVKKEMCGDKRCPEPGYCWKCPN